MTNRKQEIKERLQREFEICDKHILRINEALEELSAVLPLSSDNYATLNSGYHILPDANEWIYIRELRNEIAHDYPLLENDVVRILNELFSKVDVLYRIYDKLKASFMN